MPDLIISPALLEAIKTKFTIHELISIDRELASRIYTTDELINRIAATTALTTVEHTPVRDKKTPAPVKVKQRHGNVRAYLVTDPKGIETRVTGRKNLIKYFDTYSGFNKLFADGSRYRTVPWTDLCDNSKLNYIRSHDHRFQRAGFSIKHCTTF